MKIPQCAANIKATLQEYLGEDKSKPKVIMTKCNVADQDLIQSLIRNSDYGLSDALKLDPKDEHPYTAARFRAIGKLDRIAHRYDEKDYPTFYAKLREILDPEATATETMIGDAVAYLQTFTLVRFSWTNEVEKERKRRRDAASLGIEHSTLRQGTTDTGWLAFEVDNVSIGSLRKGIPVLGYKCTSVRLERRTNQQKASHLRRNLSRFLTEAEMPKAIRGKLEAALNDKSDERFIEKYYAVLNGQGVDAHLEEELTAMLEYTSHFLWLYYSSDRDATAVIFPEKVWRLVREAIYPENGGFEKGYVYINPPNPEVAKPDTTVTVNLTKRLQGKQPIMAELRFSDFLVVAAKPGTDEVINPNPVPTGYWDTAKAVLAGHRAEQEEAAAEDEALTAEAIALLDAEAEAESESAQAPAEQANAE